MSKIVLTSFTPIDAFGGVPRWNRDFMGAFPPGMVEHYSWADFVRRTGHDGPFPEWIKASGLTYHLISSGILKSDDVLVGDGFWVNSLIHPPERTLQVAHGNWSHTTADDVAKGIPPEFPHHHEAQVNFRKRFAAVGGKSVAVSKFISNQCKLQWGFDYPVINNGIDLYDFRPSDRMIPRSRPVIIHGVTNSNKGFEHIEILKNEFDAEVLLLDEAASFFGLPKYEALAQADVVVVPSAHEGNSYFVMEALACGVPVIGYDVGLLYEFRLDDQLSDDFKMIFSDFGIILDRRIRSPEFTLEGVKSFFENDLFSFDWARERVSKYSVQNFQAEWRGYMRNTFGVSC